MRAVIQGVESKGLAVIYDYWDQEADTWRESMYEIFSSPEEAIEVFTECYGDTPDLIYNPRIVQILEPIPGSWNINRIAQSPMIHTLIDQTRTVTLTLQDGKSLVVIPEANWPPATHGDDRHAAETWTKLTGLTATVKTVRDTTSKETKS